MKKPVARFEISARGRVFAVYATSKRKALQRFYALAQHSRVPTTNGYAYEPLANYIPPDEVRNVETIDCTLVCDVRKAF